MIAPNWQKGDWILNGSIAIPTPAQSTKISYNNVVASDTKKTEDGVTHIVWLRRKVVKINLVFPRMSIADAQLILTNMQGQEYSLTYPDVIFGSTTIQAYSGESSYELVDNSVVDNLSINVIEK